MEKSVHYMYKETCCSQGLPIYWGHEQFYLENTSPLVVNLEEAVACSSLFACSRFHKCSGMKIQGALQARLSWLVVDVDDMMNCLNPSVFV